MITGMLWLSIVSNGLRKNRDKEKGSMNLENCTLFLRGEINV